MSETALVEQLTADVLERYCPLDAVAAAADGWPRELWDALESTGLTRVGVSEANGGAGGGWPQAAAVLRVAAQHAAPVPIAETTVLGGWALDAAGVEIPAGPLAFASEGLELEARASDLVLNGRVARVGWAHEASAIVAVVSHPEQTVVAAIPPGVCRIERSRNLAREPRDTVLFEEIDLGRVAYGNIDAPSSGRARGALARAVQIAGALDRTLELTAEYVSVRRQFGRPIVEFQAVQQELALLAGEAAAASAAAEGAVAAAAAADGTVLNATETAAVLKIAAAKIRTGAAAAEGARIAHQLHGAIGVTYEHQLHHFTSRLWSWRDEFGSEREWSIVLGRGLAKTGGAGLWAWLTSNDGEEAA
jgi:acyl-CoA dehydrogenase